MSKLLSGQIYVKDERTQLLWVYQVDPEDLEFLKSKGEFDADGNLVLSSPFIAAIKGWRPVLSFKKADEYIDELGVPKLTFEVEKGKEFILPNLEECSNQELEKYLSFFGGWRAHLEAQTAVVESKKSVLESAFEEGLAKMLAVLIKKYNESEEKIPVKEALHGEALSASPQLRKIRQDLIDTEGLYLRLLGLRAQYHGYYGAVSRVIALRTSFRDEIT